MRKIIGICCLFIIGSCKDVGELEVKVKLPEILEEVSGIQYSQKEDAFWMLNDSGNSPSLYLVSEQGELLRNLQINAENTDWEDITKDQQGNIYILEILETMQTREKTLSF